MGKGAGVAEAVRMVSLVRFEIGLGIEIHKRGGGLGVRRWKNW